MSGIFVSYRPGDRDSEALAPLVIYRLAGRFGGNRVFCRFEATDPGANFAKVIGGYDALVALIGKGWLDAKDAEGRRRLDLPHDFVKAEIAAALAQGKLVIPVLIEGTTMPAGEVLPAEIAALAGRNALSISRSSVDFDVSRLMSALDKAVVPQGSAAASNATVRGTGLWARLSEPRTWRVLVFGGAGIAAIVGVMTYYVLDTSMVGGAPPATRGGTKEAIECPAANLAPFPWPNPPQPSVTALVSPYLLFQYDGKARSLMEVGARLEGAIARAGYRQPKYLGAGCNGFAIVLDLEHIEADGTRKAGAKGFMPPSQEEDFNLALYIRRLFYAPPGHYRQIVFVVSEQRMTQFTAAPTEAQLREIARDGTSSLPPDFVSVPYTWGHFVSALIYEFEKGPRDGDAKVIPPEGRLGATVHLMKARLF